MSDPTLLSPPTSTIPRPSLRRRSQSEQPLASKASPARSVTWKDDKERFKLQQKVEQVRPNTTSPNPALNATPATPAPAQAKGGRRVLFSTPHSLSSAHNIPRSSQTKAEVPPPYTPMNNTLLPTIGNLGSGHRGPQELSANHHAYLHGMRRAGASYPAGAPASVFPSVLAASEALRINLGLDPNQTFQPMRRPEAIPPLMAGPIPGAPPTSIYNKTPSTSVQTQLLSSLYPVPGQLQPVISQSPNLPPIVNTGASGPMRVQPGDWSCLVCSFVNWRRRKTCMRCCPFSEGNMANATGIVASPVSAARRAQMQVSSNIAIPAALPAYATPPRHYLIPVRQSVPLLPTMNPAYFSAGLTMFNVPGFSSPCQPSSMPVQMPGQPYFPSAVPAGMPLHPLGYSDPLDPLAQVGRPLTPSPTGSDSSGCSFAFSNVSITDSPATAISPSVCSNSSDGSASPATPKVDCFEPHRSSPKLQEQTLGREVQIVQ